MYAVAWRELYDASCQTNEQLLSLSVKVLKRPRRVTWKTKTESLQLRAESQWVLEWLSQQKREAQERVIFECECCFTGDVPQRMVQCCEGHVFCVECISKHVSSKLGQDADAVLNLCCPSVTDCAARFLVSQLRRALPEKLFDSYQIRLEKASLEVALERGSGGEGLEQCPFCDYVVVLETSTEEHHLFICRNPSCGKQSCRICRGEAHIPLSCEEARQKKEQEIRHEPQDQYRLSVEEGMSSALIRECRQCRNHGVTSRFVKESGCNKMTCPKCQGWTCYMCCEYISASVGYEHYCQHPRDPGEKCTLCSKCFLWDKNLEQEESLRVSKAALDADAGFRHRFSDENVADCSHVIDGRTVLQSIHDDLPSAKRQRQ